ncbi:ATP-binding protein [Streptosporangium sp. NPDC051023]|uniref:ATP-binding protein n=1 Tax=Streptosporangium sp. NPDC051023 TaxID=3155410 RepID=UPI00344D9CB7
MAAPVLKGRRFERERLHQALEQVRGGESAVLVLRGEAGAGKTALLHYVESQAEHCRVIRITGIESELELSFVALHQLCGPMLTTAVTLPAPQRHALEVTFGYAVGSAPDKLVLGLAMLSLLAEAASRWSASSMTPSGSTRPRARCSDSSPGGCSASRCCCCSPSASPLPRSRAGRRRRRGVRLGPARGPSSDADPPA